MILSRAWFLESENVEGPKMRFVDNIKDIAGIGVARIVREAEDRENWRRFCRGATADRLNDLTV